jgi:hypothetical protein
MTADAVSGMSLSGEDTAQAPNVVRAAASPESLTMDDVKKVIDSLSYDTPTREDRPPARSRSLTSLSN